MRRRQVLLLEVPLQLLWVWFALVVRSCSVEDVIDGVVIGKFLSQVKLLESFCY